MVNKRIIEAKLRENLMLLSDGDEEKAKELWEVSKGDDLDALMIRTKIFKDLGYCFKCGRKLDFVVETNGIPHCLGPCELSR